MSSVKNENEELQPIDLMDLFQRFWKTFRRMWVLILVLALLCSVFFYVRSARSFRPQYESRALFTVTSGYTADSIFTSSYYDNLAAQQMAETFPYMLQTELMRDLMLQQLGTAYINGTITPSAVANTNMFTLTVRSSSPEDAYAILWAAIDCYPQVAVYMVDNPQVIIQQEPTVPTAPCNTFSWKGPVARGLLVGIAAGLAIIFAVSLFTKTVGTVDQLKSLIDLPILAVLPRAPAKKRRSEKQQFIMAANSPALEEPLRGLKMKVRKVLSETSRNVVLVTSTLAGEGKTTVAVNLALSLAENGKRVVLVDADLRNQSIAARFGGTAGTGLIDCLKNPKISVTEKLVRVNDSSLYYLSGKNASDLRYNVDPKALRRVLSVLSQEFDYVVMDTAPCAMVADTALLCHNADCVLYVVKPDYARQSLIFDTVNSLYNRDVPVAGFVFNNVPVNHSHYGYGYKYAYGYSYKYGYGYGSKHKSKKKASEPGET